MSVLFSFLFHTSYFVSLHIFSEEHLLSSLYLEITPFVLGFPGGIVVKNRPANAEGIRDAGSSPGSGRCPGGGHGNPLQYSCLEKPTDRGVWWATVHWVANSQTYLKQLPVHASI